MSLASKIEEMFKSKELVSQENVNLLIQEAIHFVSDLKTRLASNDETVRDAAINDAKKMQTEMQEQMQKMGSSMNVSPQQISDNFAATKEGLAGAKNDSESDMYAQALHALHSGMKDQPKKAKPKHVKEWLAS